MAAGPRLRIAFLAYRGNPRCGGQGVYTRHLTRELAALGHHVEVVAGPPYPDLDPPVGLVRLPSLDIYREDDPFRKTAVLDVRGGIDALEWVLASAAAFPEPRTFSLRAWRHLARRPHDFDVVHDNQSLAWGLLGVRRLGLPVVATLHHPITVDRAIDLAAAPTLRRRLMVRRWYSFVRMQRRVAPRLERIVTVSESSRADIVRDMGVAPERLAVVPVGVDPGRFRPVPDVARVPGRVMTTARPDTPLKGLLHLLEAVAKVRTERPVELVVVGRPPADGDAVRAVERLGLAGAVRFVPDVHERRMVELYAESEVAVVPSLYEGFSLPAVEAMACGVPLVATTGGALPEVAGRDGRTALLVPPADAGALAAAVGRLLDDAALRHRLGAAGRARVLERFTWRACAEGTVEQYRAVLGDRPAPAVAA